MNKLPPNVYFKVHKTFYKCTRYDVVLRIAKERWWGIDHFNGTISENVREDGTAYSA